MFKRLDDTTTRGTKIIVFLVLAAASFAAPAQNADPLQSVMTRPRPSFDALGTRIGIFDLNAGINLGIEHSDNILAASLNEIDDVLTVVDPSLRLSTDWGRAALEVSAIASFGRHADNPDEDFDDHSIRLNWNRRLGADGRLGLGAMTSRGHDTRRDPSSEDGIEPSRFDANSVNIFLTGRIGVLDLEGNIEARDIDYEDARSLDSIINNDDRDRRQDQLRIRIGLYAQRVFSPFIEINADERNYEQQFDDFGVARSSDGTAVGVGVRFRESRKFSGEIILGRIERDYQSSQFSDSDRFWMRSSLEWNPTGLTTLSLDYESRIDETTYGAISGVEVDHVGFTVDHELLRNVVISAGIRSDREEYVSSPREDDSTLWFAGATYLVNNHLRVSLELESNDRDSTIGSESFNENIYRIVFRTTL